MNSSILQTLSYMRNYKSKFWYDKLSSELNNLTFSITDPDTDSWFLYSSPLPSVLILTFYTTFSLYLGPKLMKDRKPFNLLWVIRAYNVFQIGHNTFLLLKGVTHANYFEVMFKLGCHQMSQQDQIEFNIGINEAFWHYYVNKLMDLLDTIFFVLRKKQSHITFLHIYHHISMVILVYGIGKYFAGSEGQLTGFINIIVHIFMYFYYTVSSFGTTFTFHLKYKKYLTRMQIAQFVIVLIHSVAAHYVSCGFNLIVIKIFMIEAIANLLLFLNFYRKTYGKGKGSRMFHTTICSPLQQKALNDPQSVSDENGNIRQKSEWTFK